MAKKVESYFIDDIDGSRPAERVRFGLDGIEYEVDLGEHNRGVLEDALAPFVEAGNRVSGRGRRPSRTTAGGREKNQAARAWLRDRGYEISNRGRIPAELMKEYEAQT